MWTSHFGINRLFLEDFGTLHLLRIRRHAWHPKKIWTEPKNWLNNIGNNFIFIISFAWIIVPLKLMLFCVTFSVNVLLIYSCYLQIGQRASIDDTRPNYLCKKIIRISIPSRFWWEAESFWPHEFSSTWRYVDNRRHASVLSNCSSNRILAMG